ncbi:signal peptide containing protein [Theileria equi strain WA]|uniref:Signal peptide containing protein n=1 Tax=Theileria equi strain WA TaxID=1537102 RepID=L1LAE8_THEEQ|nr:signal peptide containing protein [Theileria equi strain WA]EKX72234.1 signal peptide containing protein [Theileria equi strain WA]|eukprot:XP_004831686.1 signal peptide containing protein [Theileria equi strain WA]
MRILAVLLTVSLVGVCHGKGGNKKPPTQPATPAAKGQATPQAPQNPPKDPTTSKESPAVKPAPQQTAKPGSVPEVKQEKKPPANLQGSVKKEQAQVPQEQQAKPADKPVESPETAEDNVEEKVKSNEDGKPAPEPTGSKDTTLQTDNPTAGRSSLAPQPARQDGSSGNTNANREATPPKPTTPVPLNLANPNESQITVETGSYSGVSLKSYTPKDGHHISSVVNADKELWTAKDKEKCLLAGSYAKGDIELLYLDIDNNGRFDYQYFEKVDGKWNGITQGDFLKKLKERYNPDNILDLTSPDKSKVKIGTKEDKGLKHKNFSLKHDCVISLVVDGKAMLWTASGKEECLSAKLSSKGDSSLAMIWVYAGSSSGYKYFEKNANGEWKKITEEEHNKKLKELQPPAKPEESPEVHRDDSTEDNQANLDQSDSKPANSSLS